MARFRKLQSWLGSALAAAALCQPAAARSYHSRHSITPLDIQMYGGGAIVVGGVGLVALFAQALSLRLYAASARSWPRHPATILTREIIDQDDSSLRRRYGVKLTYAYQVNGVNHTGDRQRFGTRLFHSRGEAEDDVAAFPVGAVVDVAVDPANPTSSVLDPVLISSGSGVAIPVFLLLILAGAAVLAFGTMLRK